MSPGARWWVGLPLLLGALVVLTASWRSARGVQSPLSPGNPGPASWRVRAAGRPQSPSVNPSRSEVRLRASSRETCIWDSPTSAAIWDWDMPRAEAQREDPAFPGGQPGEQRAQRLAVLDEFQPAVERGQVALIGVLLRGRQRDRGVDGGRLQRLEHEVDVDLEVTGDLLGGGGAVQAVGQLLPGLGDHPGHLLHPAWYPHRPAAVAEVPADLAEDGRHGERGEGSAVRVVPVHRVQQTDRADLDQVVVGLAPAAEPLREVMDEGELLLHHLAPQVEAFGVLGRQRCQPQQACLGCRLQMRGVRPALRRGTGPPRGRDAMNHVVLRPAGCVSRIQLPAIPPLSVSTSPTRASSNDQAKLERSGRLRRGPRDHHLEGAGVHPERRGELPAVVGTTLEQQRARLVDGDAQVLDLVEGQVESGGQAGHRRPHHREVRRIGGHPQLDGVVRPQRLPPRRRHRHHGPPLRGGDERAARPRLAGGASETARYTEVP